MWKEQGEAVSLYQFQQAQDIQRDYDPSVDTLIMAAVRHADPVNLAKLEAAWPELVAEWRYRYWSGSGLLPREAGYDPEFDENIRIQAEEVLRGQA
jgi:hypothetical protein